jgi:protein SSD1
MVWTDSDQVILMVLGRLVYSPRLSFLIRSCSKLAYEDAQSVIDDGHLPDTTSISTFSKDHVETSIKNLFKLSAVLRKKRYDNGALSMNSVKLSFTLDDDNNPIDVSVFESKEANKLIEEFMLLANISVAEKIYDAYPSTSLLRRHEVPIERRLVI